MITHHQLRTFLAVARTGSLTRAARELSATQPTVSLQLNALRKFLGTPLFERPGGRFRLTAAGERLRRYAEESVAGLRSLQQDVALLQGNLAKPLQGSLVGPLAIGFTYVLSRYVMPSVLSRFLEEFSGVEVHLTVDVPEPMFSALLRNSLDVAYLINISIPSGLTVERLCEEEFVVFASSRHPLAGRRLVTPQELATHPFVASLSPPLRTLIDAKLRGAGVTPRIAAEALHHDAIKKLVDRDFGYSMLIKAAVADELATGQLVALRLDGPPIATDLVAVYRTRPTISPVIREFIDFTRRHLVNRDRDVIGVPARRAVPTKDLVRSTPRRRRRRR
jgi:DNA-binding transcriptional LysR family regulator